MVCAHAAELLKQNSATLDKLWPGAPFGIYSAELNRRDTLFPVIFGGIGSVVRPAQAFGHRDVLIIDEAHLVSDNTSTMYQRFIAALKETNPNLIVVGFTATPYRMKIGLITDGELFDDIVFDLTSFDNFNRLVALGYLAPLISRRTKTEYDISEVGTVGGDYNQKQLAKAVSKSDITRAACLELIGAAEDRHCGIIFGDSIEHGEEIASILNGEGEAAGCVHSKQGKTENAAIMSAHRAGEIKWLVNKDILTTGYDWPPLDICGMLRHTQSPGLWVQMLGRLTRPYDFQNEQQYKPGFEYAKANALILDFARNSERLGPVNDPKLPRKKGKGTGDAPIRLCESCGCYNHASARVCDECGAPFTFKPKITENASQADVMRSPVPVVEHYHVNRVSYRKLQRPGSAAMMQV
jgi:DNA repair protein RadD